MHFNSVPVDTIDCQLQAVIWESLLAEAKDEKIDGDLRKVCYVLKTTVLVGSILTTIGLASERRDLLNLPEKLPNNLDS